MTYKIVIKAYGLTIPLNHKYYRNREEAQRVADFAIRTQFAGRRELVKVIQVSNNEF